MSLKAGRFGVKREYFDGDPNEGKLKEPEIPPVPEVPKYYVHNISFYFENSSYENGYVYFSFINKQSEVITENSIFEELSDKTGIVGMYTTDSDNLRVTPCHIVGETTYLVIKPLNAVDYEFISAPQQFSNLQDNIYEIS